MRVSHMTVVAMRRVGPGVGSAFELLATTLACLVVSLIAKSGRGGHRAGAAALQKTSVGLDRGRWSGGGAINGVQTRV